MKIGRFFIWHWPRMWLIWWKRRKYTFIYENGHPVDMTARRWLKHLLGMQPYGSEAHFASMEKEKGR